MGNRINISRWEVQCGRLVPRTIDSKPVPNVLSKIYSASERHIVTQLSIHVRKMGCFAPTAVECAKMDSVLKFN